MNRIAFISNGRWFSVPGRTLPEWRLQWIARINRDVLRRRRLGWRA